ncbi:hypothetical protein H6F76_00120 [Leptolyngbya sp. FACHB-321]|nr:hypothetical protein [Leptolyngbya sp. FACHB-321]MBD2033473.1 hypothetical protein [Leptolyngbya sp. FACHB-321]
MMQEWGVTVDHSTIKRWVLVRTSTGQTDSTVAEANDRLLRGGRDV